MLISAVRFRTQEYMQILGELAPEMASLRTGYSEPLSLSRLPELKHVAIMNGPATKYG